MTTSLHRNMIRRDSFTLIDDLKKKALSFFISNIRTARLFFTDVTPVQLLTEEAIVSRSPNGFCPDTRTMRIISKAAFEIGDYWRIVDVIHRSLKRFDKRKWNEFYKALILLEYLLTHGPQSVAEEFEFDIGVIREAKAFHYIDEKTGFDWGTTVEKKAERVLKLLEKRQFLKQERERCRKLTRGIQGFGSQRSLNLVSAVDSSNNNAPPSPSKQIISVRDEEDKENSNCNYEESIEDRTEDCTSVTLTPPPSTRRRRRTPVKDLLAVQESTPLLSLKSNQND